MAIARVFLGFLGVNKIYVKQMNIVSDSLLGQSVAWFCRHLMLRLFYCICLAGSLIISPVWATGSIGRADLVIGQVFVQDVHGVNKPVTTGFAITEGQVLSTGADGYLYINTVDQGFISLRPNTKITLEVYRYDAKAPKNTQIRIQLHYGVMRSVSGQGAQSARDKYRLNTPVAAIGIRGTDFTVFASSDITRATVRSGGIAVAPLANGCQAQALGPCEGANTLDLLAHSAQLLQLTRGDRRPVILDNPELRPDRINPPRADELAKLQVLKDGGDTKASSALSTSVTPLETLVVPQLVKVAVPEPERLQWGRWQALVNLPAIDMETLISKDRELISLVGPYFMGRERSPVILPNGTYQFGLRAYEAYFLDQRNGQASMAQITDPSLTVNFDQRSFVTSFTVSNARQSVPVNAQGGITSDGKIVGDMFYVNATVRGALAGPHADQAGFLFHRPIDEHSSAIGATRWGR